MFEEILKSLESRQLDTGYGISTAQRTIKSIAACFTGGLCPTKIFDIASSEVWLKELEDSANRLTYCGKEMNDPDFITKSIRDGADITPGAILEYDAILSAKSRDRDRDIIDQKGGLEVDLKMPLLWQHIQVQPIGKHVALISQDEHKTICRFAIADTQLGRDAAVLVRFGALRKSHGFRPSDVAPIEIIKGADGKDLVRGWHIKKADCMEGSLVSIPSNPDASVLETYEKEFDGVVTPYSRGLLKNEGVVAWAKSVYDARPVQVQGMTIEKRKQVADATLAACTCQSKKVSEPVVVKATSEMSSSGHANEGEDCPRCKSGKLDSTGSCMACGYVHGKSLAEELGDKAFDLTTKYYGSNCPYPAGSFEAIQYSLANSAAAYLRGKEVEGITEYDYVYLVATFSDSAVVCWSRGDTRKCWRVSYEMSGDSPKFSGDPVAVEIQAVVVEKMLGNSTQSQVEAAVKNATPPVMTLTELARKMAGHILTADGTGGEVRIAVDTVSKSFATLKQCEDAKALLDLIS